MNEQRFSSEVILADPLRGTDADLQRWRQAVRSSTLGNYHHKMGRALLQLGERAAAIQALEKALEVDATHYASARLLVRLLEERGEGARADAIRNRIFGHDRRTEALALVQECYESLDSTQIDTALSFMRQALALDAGVAAYRPDDLVTLAGRLKYGHEEAVHWCQLAAPFASDRYALHHQVGFSLLMLNRPAEALRELHASIAADSARMSSWYVVGHCHRLRFETEAALAAYGRVWESGDPLSRWAGIMMALTLLCANRLQEAVDVTIDVRTAAPGMKWIPIIQGLALFHSGESDAAAEMIEQGGWSGPEATRAIAYRGLANLMRGRPVEALVDLAGDRGDFHMLALPRLARARALLELGNEAEARQLIETAATEEPQWVQATVHLLGSLGEALTPYLFSEKSEK